MVKTFVDEYELSTEAFLTEYNRDIEEALQEYDRGEYLTQEELEKKYLTPNA